MRWPTSALWRCANPRVGKFALIRHQRYARAKQFNRANRALRTLRTQLGRVIRDIGRKIAGDATRREIFARPFSLARRVHEQRQRQRGHKVYSLHAPEVECIGRGKAHRACEFGVKVSLATPLRRCRGGQFVALVAAIPGTPSDGHTLAAVVPRSRARSASRSPASSPMPATAVTTHRAVQACASSRPGRSATSPSRTSATCDDARRWSG